MSTYNFTKKVTKDNSRKLRLKAMEAAKAETCSDLNSRIKNLLITAWGEWQPDYEGWLKWSSRLYTPDATIAAIGDEEQLFSDYQKSMGQQRAACDMEMGPIMQMTVEDDTAALIYHMYLTPKGMENAPTFDMIVTEFNKVAEVNGKLMVTHLDLYTDGGGLNMAPSHNHQ